MYLTPSPETLLNWHGVFFVHDGPYAGSILRFTLLFPTSFPRVAPTVRFDSEIFHPLVDPKTKIWTTHGKLGQWRPRVNHIAHLLHELKRSFTVEFLDSMAEDEASNKQIWSLYHHSHQTFISMTSQRALKSSSHANLFPREPIIVKPPFPDKPRKPSAPSTPPRLRTTSGLSTNSPAKVPVQSGRPVATPLTPPRQRTTSGLSTSSGALDSGPIVFRELTGGEEEMLRGKVFGGVGK